MSDQLEKLLAQKPMKKPAKAWVNWYLALVGLPGCADGSQRAKPGEKFHGAKLWPSKDAAETWVTTEPLKFRFPIVGTDVEYLGAYPEGERP